MTKGDHWDVTLTDFGSVMPLWAYIDIKMTASPLKIPFLPHFNLTN